MKSSLFLVFLLPFFLQVKLVDVSEKNLPVDDLNKNSMDVVNADLDKDGDQDLIVACEFCPNYILVNDGNGIFRNESNRRLPQVVHDSEDIAVEDFDKDGDLDIVFVSEDDQVHEYYINDGKGFFSDASSRFAFNSTANSVCAFDADKDGDKDLVIGNAGQDFLLLNDGMGNWSNAPPENFPSDSDVTQDVKAFDAEGDGDPDLIFGNEDRGKLYINNGKGKFVRSEGALPEVVHTVETRKVEAQDVDKDGDTDLFYCNVAFRKEKERKNLLLLNDGKGKFSDATSTNYLGQNLMMSLDAQFIDLDGNGWKDLIVANGFGSSIQYFTNEKGRFTEITDGRYPAFANSTIISLLHFQGKKKGPEYLYLGLFRGKDKLLQVEK